jgi:MoxR-like ATPase
MRLVEQHLAGEAPPLLVLEGEPGIGKMRLLEEAATVAAQRGLKVVHGTVQVAGNQVPRDPVLNALRNEVERHSPVLLRRDRQGCAWLVRVLPELTSGPIEPVPPAPLSAEQESVLTVRAIVRFLTNIAGPAGTLLTLDNLHRADARALGLAAKLVHITVNSYAGVPRRCRWACAARGRLAQRLFVPSQTAAVSADFTENG